jgi:hypothetical protein
MTKRSKKASESCRGPPVDLELDQYLFAYFVRLFINGEGVGLETDCHSAGGRRLEVSVYDEGEYHALVFPCRRDGSGWRDVSANRSMPLRPTHWRLWEHRRL